MTNDSEAEADEDFLLQIVSVTGGVGSTTASSGTATIAANDPPTVSIANAADVTEGSAATFIVSLSGAPAVPLTVDFATAAGSAGAADFTATTRTLTFNPGEATNQAVVVPTLEDSLVEPTESFVANLSNVTNGAIGVAQGSANIFSDDVPVISISDASPIAEGSDAIFTVLLDQAPIAPVTITVTSSPGTASGQDFSSVNTTLTFNPGEALSQQVTCLLYTSPSPRDS